MSKKKIALTACAAVLTGVLAAGGTLAYLTQQTNTVKNVFTGENSNLGGRIDEEFDRETAEKYLPGDVITKKPVLKNMSEALSSYVAVKVSIEVENELVDYGDFAEDYGTIEYKGVEGFNTDDWEEIAVSNQPYKLFVYKKAVAPGESTSEIFDQVTVSAQIKTVYDTTTDIKRAYREITKEDYDLLEDKTDTLVDEEHYYLLEDVSESSVEEGTSYFVTKDGEMVPADLTRLPKFNVDVKGYMIQEKNVTFDQAKIQLAEMAAAN